jgi:quercetin dioxygenase-like cupin family protein
MDELKETNSIDRRHVFGLLAGLALLGVKGVGELDGQATKTADAADLGKSRVFKFSAMELKKTSNGGWSTPIAKGTLPTGEFVECHQSMLPPGQQPHPPHRHPNTEFILLREGKVEYLNEGESEMVVPGDVIFTASNRLHGLKNVGDVNAIYYVVSVSKQLTA